MYYGRSFSHVYRSFPLPVSGSFISEPCRLCSLFVSGHLSDTGVLSAFLISPVICSLRLSGHLPQNLPWLKSRSTIRNLQEKPCQTQKLTFSVRGKGERQLCGTLEIKRRKRLSFGSVTGYAGKLSHADGNGF